MRDKTNTIIFRDSLCRLLQSVLFDGIRIDLSPDQRAEAFRTAHEQKVVPLAYAGAKDAAELKNEFYASVVSFYRLLSVQTLLTDVLTAEGITPVILKGTAAGIYYPHPEYRTYGDIDFFVKPEDFERALAILGQNDFRVAQTVRPEDRHVVMLKNGVTLELHRYWCGLDQWNSPLHGEEMNARIFSAQPVQAELDGQRFFMLPTAENGLVLLTHINNHIAHGIGLRQVLDWMMFVKENLTDAYWQAEFGPLAKRYGLDRLAVILSHMCQMYLGLEGREWYSRADEKICAELMDYILASGNFGEIQSRETDTHIKGTLLSRSTVKGFFGHLHRSGLRQWKAAQEHKFLRPFAGLYCAGHYVSQILRRKDGMQRMKNAFTDAAKHRKLMRAIRPR